MQDVFLEYISARHSPEVIVSHELDTCKRLFRRQRNLHFPVIFCSVTEHHHIGISISHHVDTLFVVELHEFVVSIHKLQIFTRCHHDSGITCCTGSGIRFPHINHIVGISHKTIHRADVRSVVYHDHLPLIFTQREIDYAFHTFYQHGNILVVISHHKRDERSLSSIAINVHELCRINKRNHLFLQKYKEKTISPSYFSFFFTYYTIIKGN